MQLHRIKSNQDNSTGGAQTSGVENNSFSQQSEGGKQNHYPILEVKEGKSNQLVDLALI
jgi:hypothetical protein